MVIKAASKYLGGLVFFFFFPSIYTMEKWSKTGSIFIDITKPHNRTVGGWTKSSGSHEGYKD